MLSKREMEIFKKYEKGDYLDNQHRSDVYDLASIKLARIGFSSEKDETKETAVLTRLGKSILRREKIRKNPIKNFFYSLINAAI